MLVAGMGAAGFSHLSLTHYRYCKHYDGGIGAQHSKTQDWMCLTFIQNTTIPTGHHPVSAGTHNTSIIPGPKYYYLKPIKLTPDRHQ